MHGKSDLLDLYVGKLSPKTALMYIQKIMQFDQPRCTNINTFKHIICKTVKAYNEHEKENDFAKRNCTLKTCPAIFFGWHPLLVNTFHALLQTGFEFARIAETFLEILKKLPVHVAESMFRVLIAKKHDQANTAKLPSRLVYEAFSEVSLKRTLNLSLYEDIDYPVEQHHDGDFYPEPV